MATRIGRETPTLSFLRRPYGLLYAPGERNVRVGSFETGALLAGVDERRQVIAARVDATGRPWTPRPSS